MSRQKVELPSQFQYKTELSVRVSDINYGAHLANDAVLRFFHEGRMRWLAEAQSTEVDIAGSGIGMIQTETWIQYANEGFFGDHLELYFSVSNQKRKFFECTYLLFNPEKQKEIARGTTGMLLFDYTNKKVASPTGSIAELFSKPGTVVSPL